MNLVFLGMGKMGLPLARHLQAAGYAVTVHDPASVALKMPAASVQLPEVTSLESSPSPVVTLASKGVEPFPSAPSVVRSSSVIETTCWPFEIVNDAVLVAPSTKSEAATDTTMPHDPALRTLTEGDDELAIAQTPLLASVTA